MHRERLLWAWREQIGVASGELSTAAAGRADVVADGFVGPGKLRGPQKSIYRTLCDCWAIDELGDVEEFTREMERIGFREIVVEQAQARVTPSVLHVPWVTLRFLVYGCWVWFAQDDTGAVE